MLTETAIRNAKPLETNYKLFGGRSTIKGRQELMAISGLAKLGVIAGVHLAIAFFATK